MIPSTNFSQLIILPSLASFSVSNIVSLDLVFPFLSISIIIFNFVGKLFIFLNSSVIAISFSKQSFNKSNKLRK